MCRYSPGAAEGAWEDPQAHGLELDTDIFVHTSSSCLCAKRVKIYVDLALKEYLVVIKRLGSLGSRLFPQAWLIPKSPGQGSIQ